MKKFFLLVVITAIFSCTKDRDIKSNVIVIDPNSVLVYYWNFNKTSGTLSSVNADYSLIAANAKITYPGTGAGFMDSFSPGYTNNLRNSDLGGLGIRARNPSNTRDLIIAMPTTGFKNAVVQFATAKSGSGATTQNYSYTSDGTNYINTNMNINTYNPLDDPTATGVTTPAAVSLVAIDFSAIAAVNNNPNFKLKISFGGTTAAGTSGNNRFDNLTLEAEPN